MKIRIQYSSIPALIAILGLTSASAAITITKDSSSFAYLYEMDVNPSGQDLDSNSTADWFAGTAGGTRIPQTYTGGVAASNQAAATPEILFRTDYGGSLTRNTLSSGEPFTLEWRVRKTGGAQGADGWFGLAVQSPGDDYSARVNIEDDRVSFRDGNAGGANADFLVGTNFADGNFHTVRLVKESGNEYYVWVNGVLLNADLSTPFVGGNGSFNSGGSWFIGDFTGGIAGDWEVDYIRFDDGVASAPITVSGTNLTWTAATDSVWDIATTSNWQLADTTPVTFENGDSVTFDDTASSGAVTLSGVTISPDSITFANNSLAYTISGDGWSGPGNLAKSGTADVTILNNALHTGTTTVDAGTLFLGNGGTTGRLGAGAITLTGNLSVNRSDSITLSNSIDGVGTLSIDGTGTVVLSGTSTHTGSTTVNSGTLRVEGSTASTATVQSGATIAAGPSSGSGSGTVGGLVLAAGSKSSFRLGSVAQDSLTVSDSSGLDLAGSHQVDLIPTSVWTTGDQFDLIDYNGAPSGDVANLQVGSAPHGQYTFSLDGVDEVVVLEVTLLDTLVWTGATDGNWDLDTTQNWELLSDSSAATYFAYDQVAFNDSASTGVVTLTGSFEPFSISIDNDTLAYSFSGGELSGSAGIEKAGPGAVTWASANSSTGANVVSAGTLTFGDGASSGEIGFGSLSISSGATVEIDRSDTLDYKTSAKLRVVNGAGDFVLRGGGALINYAGGGLGFADAGSWAGFSGNLSVIEDSEFRTIRNGATAMGSGNIILGDGSSSGSLAPFEGNWTWTNAIQLVGSSNAIINRSTGADRSLKLQGTVSGAGNLVLQDATGAMDDLNRGYIITNGVTMSGTLTIDSAVPVRVGGVPGEDVTLVAASSGSLGTTAVVNNGTLTFSRTDSHSIDSAISGTGDLRIGIPSTAGFGDTSTQVVTISDGTKTYSGTTTVEAGTLSVTGSLPNSAVQVNAEGTLGGTGTISGSVTVNGTLAAGTSVGTLTVGALTLEADSSMTTELGDWSVPEADLIIADSLVINSGTGTETVITIDGSLISNFSETTTTIPLIQTPVAVTGFDVADFTIQTTNFAGVGTWSIQLSGDTTDVELVYTAGAPANDFANWIDGFYPGETDPAIIGFDADPDADGLTNGEEAAFGTDPSTANSGVVSGTKSGNTYTFTHPNPTAGSEVSDVSLSYEWSLDLSNWNSSGATVSGTTVTITSQADTPGANVTTVTATITDTEPDNLFLRASVAN